MSGVDDKVLLDIPVGSKVVGVCQYSGGLYLATSEGLYVFNEDKDTRNFNMQAIIEDKQPIYSYKMTRGISSIKGGICVLRELKYPKIIIQNTEKILKKL